MRLFSIIFLLSVISAGCGSTTEPEQTTAPVSDRYQVAEVALRFMMDKNSKADAEGGKFSAYVIEDGEFTAKLVKAFTGYTPQVVSGVHVDTTGREAIDIIGNRVKLWSVEVVDVNKDRAAASVKSYAGNLEAATYTLMLRNNDDGWFVESEAMEMAS